MQKSQASLISLVLGLLILGGCSSVEPLVVKVSPVKQVPLNLPAVDPLKLDTVEWYIVNESNVEEVCAELEKKNYDRVIFGLNDKGYENMSVNMAKILALIEQQKSIIGAYKSYYNRQIETIETHNDEQKKEQQKVQRVQKNESNKGIIERLRFW